jgi:hypothetical protein
METIEMHCFRICARVPEGTPHLKIPFLADRARGGHAAFVAREQTRRQVVFFGCALSLRIQPKRFELPTPFRWSIAQPFDVDASRQAALHGRADQLGSKKGERDSHVDMTDAALLAQRNLLSISDGAFDNFV